MQDLLDSIEHWHVHPFVDHFSVAILIIAVLADLCASLFSARMWLRYSALAMTIIAAGAAWLSYVTGGWAAHSVYKTLKANGGPALDIFGRHAEIGEILAWVITGLAIWRLGIQAVGTFARSRALYLLLAVLTSIGMLYQGYLGGEMVYVYGVGTDLMTSEQQRAPEPTPAPAGPSTPIPTVYVPAAAATPAAGATPLGAEPGTSGASPTPAQVPSPSASPSPLANPAPTAASASGYGDSKTSNASPGTTIRPPDPHPGAASL
jgi:uncharacterized membrane protein